MTRIISLTLIISFSLLTNRVFGQRSEQESKLGTWSIYNGFFEFSPKFQLFFEIQWRTYQFLNNTEDLLFRPYFNYRINKQNLVGISTEYMTLNSFGENNVRVANELRIGLQYENDSHAGKLHLQHRVRYELRFFDTRSNSQRVRYRFQIAAPLTKKGFKKGGVIFIINNEIFFGTYPEINYNQNRFYTSLGYQITDNLNIQVGYQNWDRRDGNYNRIQFWFTQHVWLY